MPGGGLLVLLELELDRGRYCTWVLLVFLIRGAVICGFSRVKRGKWLLHCLGGGLWVLLLMLGGQLEDAVRYTPIGAIVNMF